MTRSPEKQAGQEILLLIAGELILDNSVDSVDGGQ